MGDAALLVFKKIERPKRPLTQAQGVFQENKEECLQVIKEWEVTSGFPLSLRRVKSKELKEREGITTARILKD